MANLVIVESPAKANTIKGYLGSNYKVVASKGHIRDLPKSTLGIDVDNNFETKGVKNLFVGGDGAGITRGLAQAGANGVAVARIIANR